MSDMAGCSCSFVAKITADYLRRQLGQIETLVSLRGFLQSTEGQTAQVERRLLQFLQDDMGLSRKDAEEISDFQKEYSELWMAGLAELRQIALTKNRDQPSPNWSAYDAAFSDVLCTKLGSEADIRKTISAVNTAKVHIWTSIQKSSVDEAFLLLSVSDMEYQLQRILVSLDYINTGRGISAEIDLTLLSGGRVFPRFQGNAVSPFLEQIELLESQLYQVDEFIKTRANLGVQLRHVHAHNFGRIDEKARKRLGPPFTEEFIGLAEVPLGWLGMNLGTDFFMDVFAALCCSFLLELWRRAKIGCHCGNSDPLFDEQVLIGMAHSMPRTWAVMRANNVL